MTAPRVIFHLDMDAFYASIEQRDNPALLGKPVIVGSPPSQRGVVCAASYEARKFGVHSALPSVTAGRLCPKGVFIRPRMELYRQESEKIMQILAQSGAEIETTSIDEAYLDFSAILANPSSAVDPDEALYRSIPIARALKEAIRTGRHLNATIGIAPNKLLAKIGSDFQKPNGLTLIPERDKVQFLRPMRVRTIPGIGKVTEQALHAAGITEIGHLQDFTGDLRPLLGSFGATLRKFAFGDDDRPLSANEESKSISSEETFERDTEDRQILRRSLRTQAEEIAQKLREKALGAHTVQVKVRYSDFITPTRQITVEEPISDANDIYRLACFLLARDRLVHRPLRLLGLGVSSLGEPLFRQLLLPFFKK